MPPPTSDQNLTAALRQPFAFPINRITGTWRAYSLASLRGDALAGLTVAVIAVPQCMAYAIIAGVPAVYGLYTVAIQSLIAPFFNSHPLLSVGPNITQSLLVASVVTRLVEPGDPALYLQLVIALAMLKGLVQLVMASARLGNLARYVSQSMIVGFIAGAGVLIAVGQIHGFLGFATPRTGEAWPGIVGELQRLVPHLARTSPWAVLMGSITLIVVIGARYVSRIAPGPLLAIIITAGIVAGVGWTQQDLSLLGQIPRGLSFTLPTLGFQHLDALITAAVALAFLGLMEPYSISKALPSPPGLRVSANRELFSQGVTNFISSFFSCIPGSGSFSRSALNEYAGARTFMSSIFNGLFVLAIFLLLGPWARYVPMSTIAAILFVIAAGLINWRYFIRILRSNKGDAAVCLGTFLATLLLPLAYAVFVGVFLNLALYLRLAGQLHIAEMVPTTAGPYIERPIRDRAGDQRVIFLQLEGDLFFAVADELQDRLTAVANSGVRVAILRLKRTHMIDSTVLAVLEQFVGQMERFDGHVLLCGVKPDLLDHLQNYGLAARIGSDNIFETGYGVFTSAKRALQRARVLVDSSLDTDSLPEADEVEEWAYEI